MGVSTIRAVRSLVERMRSWWLIHIMEEAGSVWLTWSMKSLDPSSVLVSSTRSALARGRASQIAPLESECEDQLRVNHDCSKARFCKSNTDPSDFEEIDCSNDPDNHVVIVNLVYHTWYCGNDSGRCPGAFHVGCQDDPHDSSSTMSMPPTSTDPGSGSTTLAVNWILPVLAFLIVFMKF